jgi:hypothetical protein
MLGRQNYITNNYERTNDNTIYLNFVWRYSYYLHTKILKEDYMKKKGKVKFYHASRRLDWKPGDIIDTKSHEGSDFIWGRGIFMTTSPVVHFTLYEMGEGRSIGDVRYNVYQVIPHGKIRRGTWDEWICEGYVEVVKCCGEANKNGRVSRCDDTLPIIFKKENDE